MVKKQLLNSILFFLLIIVLLQCNVNNTLYYQGIINVLILFNTKNKKNIAQKENPTECGNDVKKCKE